MILYVETNFLLAIAKGQDPQADRLLQSPMPSVRLAIPSICHVEALYRWEDEEKFTNRFKEQVKLRLSDARRDRTSSNAEPLIGYLEGSLTKTEDLFNDVRSRLSQAIARILVTAEIITLTADILQEISEIILNRPKAALIKNDVTDNLILHCILHHARLHPGEVKVFLSGNTRDFGQSEVREALGNAGVENYFSSAQNFLGWLESQ